jgi:hypothetical protein
MNKNIKITNQLENMNTAGQVELSLEELEQVIGGAPAGIIGGSCDHCGWFITTLVYYEQRGSEAPHGLCWNCAVQKLVEYVRTHPEGLQRLAEGTITAAEVGLAIGVRYIPIPIVREICWAAQLALGLARRCNVA